MITARSISLPLQTALSLYDSYQFKIMECARGVQEGPFCS